MTNNKILELLQMGEDNRLSRIGIGNKIEQLRVEIETLELSEQQLDETFEQTLEQAQLAGIDPDKFKQTIIARVDGLISLGIAPAPANEQPSADVEQPKRPRRKNRPQEEILAERAAAEERRQERLRRRHGTATAPEPPAAAPIRTEPAQTPADAGHAITTNPRVSQGSFTSAPTSPEDARAAGYKAALQGDPELNPHENDPNANAWKEGFRQGHTDRQLTADEHDADGAELPDPFDDPADISDLAKQTDPDDADDLIDRAYPDGDDLTPIQTDVIVNDTPPDDDSEKIDFDYATALGTL